MAGNVAPSVGRWRLDAQGGDAVRSTIVTVIDRPIWQEMQLDVTPPDYANLEKQSFAEALPLTVPCTTIQLTATPHSLGACLHGRYCRSNYKKILVKPQHHCRHGHLISTATIDAPQTWQALPIIRFPDDSTIRAQEATPLRLACGAMNHLWSADRGDPTRVGDAARSCTWSVICAMILASHRRAWQF